MRRVDEPAAVERAERVLRNPDATEAELLDAANVFTWLEQHDRAAEAWRLLNWKAQGWL